jgi:hypothetical protein
MPEFVHEETGCTARMLGAYDGQRGADYRRVEEVHATFGAGSYDAYKQGYREGFE